MRLLRSWHKKGIDLNENHEGKTLLIAAVEQNQLGLVKVLLEKGAAVNLIFDPAIGSALQIALRKKYADIELLLRAKGRGE